MQLVRRAAKRTMETKQMGESTPDLRPLLDTGLRIIRRGAYTLKDFPGIQGIIGIEVYGISAFLHRRV